MKFKMPCENTVAVLMVGAGMLVAEFHGIPPTSHDFVLAVSSGLLGFIAKAVLSSQDKGPDVGP